jgi:hypothetical protein
LQYVPAAEQCGHRHAPLRDTGPALFVAALRAADNSHSPGRQPMAMERSGGNFSCGGKDGRVS